MLLDQQWSWRENQALARRLKEAKLRGNVCVEDIDYRAVRALNKSVIRSLTQESKWVAQHENIFVLEPTGIGKSYIASALAHKACRDGYSAYYTRAATLFRDFGIARADGSFRTVLARLSRIDVLLIDDWAMAPLAESERRDFWEICEDRYQTRSLILTSQLPVNKWHEQIGDRTLADGILDRIVHNADRIALLGETMRKPVTSRSANNALWISTVLQRGKGLRPFPRTPFSACGFIPPLRSGLSFSPSPTLDEANTFLQNRRASVAPLRWVFTFLPECRSASYRNRVHLHRNRQ